MYKHIKTDHVYPGWPAGDMPDEAVTPEMQPIMDSLVSQGVYELWEAKESEDATISAVDPSGQDEEVEETDEGEAPGSGSETLQWGDVDRP